MGSPYLAKVESNNFKTLEFNVYKRSEILNVHLVHLEKMQLAFLNLQNVGLENIPTLNDHNVVAVDYSTQNRV